MTKKQKIGIGVVLLFVALFFAVTTRNKLAIRNGYMAAREFHLMSVAMVAQARLIMAEKTGVSTQSVIQAGSSESQVMGAVEFSESWEIAPKGAATNNTDMQIVARTIEADLLRMAEVEKAALIYYYPHMNINLEVSPVDSKFFETQGIHISLKCNN